MAKDTIPVRVLTTVKNSKNPLTYKQISERVGTDNIHRVLRNCAAAGLVKLATDDDGNRTVVITANGKKSKDFSEAYRNAASKHAGVLPKSKQPKQKKSA